MNKYSVKKKKKYAKTIVRIKFLTVTPVINWVTSRIIVLSARFYAVKRRGFLFFSNFAVLLKRKKFEQTFFTSNS
ncbi:MAG: hypothetical protein FWB84_08300 [Candidatus Bathyarchaeota archaeon]|uniref:hypothetical protein n=1 Tax=Candidatus Bathycorpusculum sp. TaxID=2994959 RepID=UPI0028372788|nr:hypothetical protein [Candidatus Termiticorpusculum sp.]